MTVRKPLIFKLFLTTCLAGTLAACGGGVPRSGGYNDEQMQVARLAAPAQERLARLEQDVASLKTDFMQLAMTYNGLMTTNERIEELLTRLEAERAKPAPVEKQALAKNTPTPAKKPAVDLPKEATVVGVRLGEHDTKTRLVVDASKLGKVTTDLDNNEKILLVTLDGVKWTAKETVSGLSSPLVAGWSVQSQDGAKVLAIQLKKPVKILATEKMDAHKSDPAKFVIDLAPAS